MAGKGFLKVYRTAYDFFLDFAKVNTVLDIEKTKNLKGNSVRLKDSDRDTFCGNLGNMLAMLEKLEGRQLFYATRCKKWKRHGMAIMWFDSLEELAPKAEVKEEVIVKEDKPSPKTRPRRKKAESE